MDRITTVEYELLRPAEVKAMREKCPVVYLPVGSLEWHGVQNPLGTDGLKAHAVCCEAAVRRKPAATWVPWCARWPARPSR